MRHQPVQGINLSRAMTYIHRMPAVSIGVPILVEVLQ